MEEWKKVDNYLNFFIVFEMTFFFFDIKDFKTNWVRKESHFNQNISRALMGSRRK